MTFTVNTWFADGFDTYTTADLLSRWSSLVGSTKITATGGRRNSGFLEGVSGNYNSGTTLTKVIPNSQDWAIQTAIKLSGANTGLVLALVDGATTQIDLRTDASNHLVVTRNGTALGTSATAMTLTWRFVEVAVHIASGTAGWVIVRVDGVTWLNLTGISTQASANAYAGTVTLYTTAGYYFPVYGFDDFLVRAGSGLSSGDLFGDIGVTALFPTADSTGANWSYGGTGITSHWDAVNDATPDGDTSYDEASVAGAEQALVFADLPAGVTVPYIEVIAYAKKTDAGTRTLKFYVNTNGAVRYSDAVSLTDSYLFYSWVWSLNPVTGVAWTAAEVNAATFGYRLDS